MCEVLTPKAMIWHSWALAFAKSTALWKQCEVSSWLGSLPPHPNNWAMATKTGNQEISSIQTRVLDTARILGCQGGDFCQPQLWKHRFTLDTRGSRSPFPLTRKEEEKPKFTTKKQDSERGFLQSTENILHPSSPSSAILDSSSSEA